MKYFLLIFILLIGSVQAQSSMRRCTLLPVTDSVGGAIGFKVFEEVEATLKESNWCTYISNSGLISVFTRYRDNLAQHLKQKEVLQTVAEKLKVGSLIRVNLVSELNGLEVQMDVYGQDGEDLFFSERTVLKTDEIEQISQTLEGWLEVYSKTIPYDAKVSGVLGEQLTLDVGKGYPIHPGQGFVIKRLTQKKKHPLLKKIVDWDTEVLAEGKVFSISDNQALGQVKVYKSDKKLAIGDWVRLEPFKQTAISEDADETKKEEPGTLGILSLALFSSSTSVETNTASGDRRMSGNIFGVDLRGEGWITRNYFAAIELSRGLGNLQKDSGVAQKSKLSVQSGVFKVTAGYKYLPIGFFYGPQIDIYAGAATYAFDLNVSDTDGFGRVTVSGILLGVSTNVPINREYRFAVRADFMPFPTFDDEDSLYGTSRSLSALDLEVALKYQYTTRITLDGGLQTFASTAKFDGSNKEFSYHDNLKLKLGASFNF